LFKHKRVAIDFDGTLVEESSNIFKDFDNDVDLKVLPGAREATSHLKKNGFEILIFTCRPDYHRKYMERILDMGGVSYDYILFYTKPRVDLYIDNKGYRFENWEDTKKWIDRKLSPNNINQEPQGPIEEKLRKQKLSFSSFFEMSGKRILDVGCGSGDVFSEIETNNQLFGIEPDRVLRDTALSKDIYIDIYTSSSEVDLSSFDYVTFFGVLEHIENRQDFLKEYSSAQKMFITVPNANSFHRLLGVKLGFIEKPESLTPGDLEIGHKIVYNEKSLREEVSLFASKHGFRISRMGTSSFKFTSSREMELFEDRFDKICELSEEIGLIGDDKYFGAELFVELEK
jgi:SAM-dependent methyltransferase